MKHKICNMAHLNPNKLMFIKIGIRNQINSPNSISYQTLKILV